jgi:hypothetical protein
MPISPSCATTADAMQDRREWVMIGANAMAWNEENRGLPPFEVDGAWPWNEAFYEAFFPKPSTITN